MIPALCVCVCAPGNNVWKWGLTVMIDETRALLVQAQHEPPTIPGQLPRATAVIVVSTNMLQTNRSMVGKWLKEMRRSLSSGVPAATISIGLQQFIGLYTRCYKGGLGTTDQPQETIDKLRSVQARMQTATGHSKPHNRLDPWIGPSFPLVPEARSLLAEVAKSREAKMAKMTLVAGSTASASPTVNTAAGGSRSTAAAATASATPSASSLAASSSTAASPAAAKNIIVRGECSQAAISNDDDASLSAVRPLIQPLGCPSRMINAGVADLGQRLSKRWADLHTKLLSHGSRNDLTIALYSPACIETCTPLNAHGNASLFAPELANMEDGMWGLLFSVCGYTGLSNPYIIPARCPSLLSSDATLMA